VLLLIELIANQLIMLIMLSGIVALLGRHVRATASRIQSATSTRRLNRKHRRIPPRPTLARASCRAVVDPARFHRRFITCPSRERVLGANS
jgi:hypothetical protein